MPLALTQGGHGTQWIGAWALASRLETIPQYYLTGYSAASLGHGLELLVALEILAAIGYGLWRMLTPRESEAALLALGVTACGVLIPVAMAVAGADYLAPRNVVGAMIPLSAGIAVIAAALRTGRTGLALVGLIAVTLRRCRSTWISARACSAATGVGSRRSSDGRPATGGRAAPRRSPRWSWVRRRSSITCRRCATCGRGRL